MDTFDYVNDPLTAGQIAMLTTLLQEEWSEKARDGFLVVYHGSLTPQAKGSPRTREPFCRLATSVCL
jgi:hypothetical protein